MSEPAPETTPYPWLDPDRVARWVKALPGGSNADVVEDVRQAAADYVESVRPDIDYTTDPTTVPERVIQAGVLATARLFARAGSPAGLVSFAEIGAATILRYDPDIDRLLEIGPYAKPAIG